MVKVYISGPITAPTEDEIRANVERADAAGRALAAAGYNPFIPHKQTQGWHATTSFTREQYLALDFDWLQLCQAIYMLPGWEESLGALAEYEEALRLGIPVVRSIDELKALFPGEGTLAPVRRSALYREPQIICEY